MITARNYLSQPFTRVSKKILAVSIITTAALAFPGNTWAAVGNNQVCAPSTSCTIGEFVYDDSYSPENSAVCTITSRYPDGTLFLNSQSLTYASEDDGWYSHTFTAPATTGLYRTNIRCTVDGSEMAIDKSFEVKTGDGGSVTAPTANEVAAATWGYSDRTLSSFGDLVSNIWSSAARTLTGSGLSSGNIATKSDVDNISTSVTNLTTQVSTATTQVQTTNTNTVNALEKYTNPPTTKHILEDGDATSVNLQSKIDKTKTTAMMMTTNVKTLKSKTALLNQKWKTYNTDKILSVLKNLKTVTGKNGDKNTTTIIGGASYISTKWGWDTAQVILSQAKNINTSISSIATDISKNGKTSTNQSDLKKLSLSVAKLEAQVGSLNSNSNDKNLYTKINNIQILSSTLSSLNRNVNEVLSSWTQTNETKLEKTVSQLSKQISSVSLIPKTEAAFIPVETSVNDNRNLKNKVFSMQGIIKANREYLSKNLNKPFTSTWMELGSIVFKTVITNPSSITTQTVPFSYDLPKEITKEDIIQMDDGITVGFDTEKNTYTATGTFTLAPNESKTIAIIVDDSCFTISTDIVSSIRKQAAALAAPLKNTSFFGQGVILKSDIDVSLDKVLALKDDDAAPAEKIKNYRESEIELKAANVKLEKLKELVTQAGSVGTFFGFVGGAQTLAVWGMIIIIVAGFVSLTLYMRSIRAADLRMNGNLKSTNVPEAEETDTKKKKKKTESTFTLEEKKPKSKMKTSAKLGMFTVVTIGTVAVSATGITFYKNITTKQVTKPLAQNTAVVKKTVLAADTAKDKTMNETVSIFVPDDTTVTIHKDSSVTSDAVAELEKSTEGTKTAERETWSKVTVTVNGEKKTGWVDSDFIDQVSDEVSPTPTSKTGKKETEVSSNGVSKEVSVLSDLDNYLKVREVPLDGKVIYKAYAGDTFPLVSTQDGWSEIELPDGSTGFISSEFVK